MISSLFNPVSQRALGATLIFSILVSAVPLAANSAPESATPQSQDKSAPTKKKSSSKKRRPSSAKKGSTAKKRRPKRASSKKSTGTKKKRPSTTKRRRRPTKKPRPKLPVLKTVPTSDWSSLANDIAALSTSLGQSSRASTDMMKTTANRSEVKIDRRYRREGDQRRMSRLLLQLEDSPTDVSTISMLADIERRNNRFQPAANYLLRALTLRPLSQDLHIQLARLYESHGRNKQAYAAYQEVVYLNSVHPEARLAQSLLLDREGDHDGATTILEEVELRAGRTANYFVYQSIHLIAVGENRSAITTASEALSSYPDEARLYDARGSAYAALGMIDDARTDYYNGLALDSDNVAVLRHLGQLSEAEHQLEVAIRSYTNVLEQFPGDPNASLGLGRNLVMDLQLGAAVDELSTYRSLHPSNSEVDQLLAQAYYLMSIGASNSGDYRQALQYQSSARKLGNAQSADWAVPALLWAGAAESTHGRDYHAVEYFSRAVKMDPFSEQGHDGLATAYESVGEKARAHYHLEEASRIRRTSARHQSLDSITSP